MTDRAQFEAMLNALINEDQEAAKEIFHNIVVAKSREIYEELLAEDFSEEEEEGVEEEFEPKKPKDTGNPYEEEGEEEEGAGEEEGAAEEEDGEGEDDGAENPFGGEDDGEEEAGDEEGEEGEGAIEDRVMDLEDALEDLKAEFEHLLAGEAHEEEQNPGIHGGELDGMMGGAEGEEEMDEFAGLMEYTIKVPTAKMGDNGVNTKSAVAGKNDMGGTTANIAKNFSTTTGGTKGGLLKPTTQEENFGNVNVPGGNAGKTAFKKREPGHGAEKKGAGEKADNKQSMLNGAPGRAK
jgi:hypothetical protein